MLCVIFFLFKHCVVLSVDYQRSGVQPFTTKICKLYCILCLIIKTFKSLIKAHTQLLLLEPIFTRNIHIYLVKDTHCLKTETTTTVSKKQYYSSYRIWYNLTHNLHYCNQCTVTIVMNVFQVTLQKYILLKMIQHNLVGGILKMKKKKEKKM